MGTEMEKEQTTQQMIECPVAGQKRRKPRKNGNQNGRQPGEGGQTGGNAG
jgi:hypothetical protein